jgi:hypothetical protein
VGDLEIALDCGRFRRIGSVSSFSNFNRSGARGSGDSGSVRSLVINSRSFPHKNIANGPMLNGVQAGEPVT